MKAPLWARKDFWNQIDELEAELARVVEETEKVAKEARSALAGLPALKHDFDAYLARRLSVWGSYVRQLVVDLCAEMEAEANNAKVGSSSAPEKEV
jgi:hypothetical protein